MIQALQMMQNANQSVFSVSPTSTILQLKAEIERLTSQVQEFENLRA